MNKNNIKYIIIIVGVIIGVFILYNTFISGEIKYDYLNPQPLQLEEQEFDTLSQDVKIEIKDEGYISKINADDEYIYYLCNPRENDIIGGFSDELTYLRKLDRKTGTIHTLHELSGMGTFNISQVVYNQDYCFINMDTYGTNNNRSSILKISKETGDSEVVYERVQGATDEYDISNMSNDFTNDYLIWKEFNSYDEEVNECKLYNIEENKVSTYKFKEKNYEEFDFNPTIHENKIVYNVLDENGDDTIMCKQINNGVDYTVNIHSLGFYTGVYNDDYVVWRSYNKPIANSITYNFFIGDIYLLDFRTKKPFLVEEQATDLRVYNDYIVTIKDNYVSLIDYKNNKKSRYLIEENGKPPQKNIQVEPTQKLVTVTDNFIIMQDKFDKDNNSVIVTYKEIVK